MNHIDSNEFPYKDRNCVDLYHNNVPHNLHSAFSNRLELSNDMLGHNLIKNMYEPYQLHTDFLNQNETVYAEIIITNLDSTIEYTKLWNILLNLLKQFAKILNLSLDMQVDGSVTATVKVSTLQEAQIIISRLNNQWIGSKCIEVSHIHSTTDSNEICLIIINLLQNIPGKQMPLFKFFKLVQSRYRTNISLSEVNKLKNICKIVDGLNGRTIVLTHNSNVDHPFQYENTFHYYCTLHCPYGLENQDFREDFSLPNVKISLKQFKGQVKELLSSHMGIMPLLSFPICYAIHFKRSIVEDDSGISLEHLLSCVSDINIVVSNSDKNAKYIKLSDTREGKVKESEDPLAKTIPAPFIENVSVLCREIVYLLKTVDKCQLLITHFKPTYHYHFGRQCRLADYGFTKLSDLFEAISHCVQIIGYGMKRMITLTHTVQVRRFTSDVLRVLKGQTLQKLPVNNFSVAYEKTFHKPFNSIEYGLCYLEDLLVEIPEGNILINRIEETDVIAIPKREQTSEQIERTKQFRSEIKEFLSHSPYCAMLFNKFVPAYHHHFGRQCKVSDYGFTKLVELFEAIPETVEVEESSGTERKVKLKLDAALEVLGNQIQALIIQSNFPTLHLDDMIDIFQKTHGYILKPHHYECKDLLELVLVLDSFVKVTFSTSGPLLSIANVDNHLLEIQTWSILLYPPYKCNRAKFKYQYRLKFLNNVPMHQLNNLKSVIEISENGDETMIALTPIYILAAKLYHLLRENNGCIELSNVNDLYLKKYGSNLSAKDFKAKSLDNLFHQIKFLVYFQKTDDKICIMLNKNVLNFGIYESKYTKMMHIQPSAHLVINNSSHIIPPKPDTPPIFGSWNPNWNYLDEKIEHIEVILPEFDVPKIDINDGLVSPTAINIFFPQNGDINKTLSSPLSNVQISRKFNNDDSGYSGFNSFRQDYTLSESGFNLSDRQGY